MVQVNHGCNKYKKNDWPIDSIRQWVAEGKTLQWIGQQIGCKNQHVSRICKKHGIETPRTGPRSGAGHPEWKGGRCIDKDGYILVYSPEHPSIRKHKPYVLEHRLVMEQAIGRFLDRDEVVHHKNGDKQDNRIENLELYSKNSEHLQAELTGKVPNWTPEGVQKWRDSRKALKPGDGQKK